MTTFAAPARDMAPWYGDDAMRALDVARGLVKAGVPVFIAGPCEPTCTSKRHAPGHGTGGTGYHLPAGWETSFPLLDVVDRWRPGHALCAVMGHAVDGLDVDPRNGGIDGEAWLRAAGAWPRSYGRAETPSGGWHDLIAPLRVGSRDGIASGVDVKGGAVDGTGRGFLFIAPTVKRSKVTGEIGAYRWAVEPDLQEIEPDEGTARLAEIVRELKGPRTAVDAPAGIFTAPDNAHTGPIPMGQRHAALVSYAGHLLTIPGLSWAEAQHLYRARWADCEQSPTAPYPVTWEEALDKLRDVWSRYPQAVVDAPVSPAVPPGVVGQAPGRKVKLASAANVKPLRARWLWAGRMPLGEITLIAGREGAGKSTLLAWMVRAITRGELPGEFVGQPRPVIYAAAEDSWAYTIVPRFIAAGVDLDLVYRVEVEDAQSEKTRMTLPLDTGEVFAAGAEIGAVALMLDPGLSFLDDRIDTFRAPEVRPALEQLRHGAEQAGMAVPMLCHFNKSTGTDVLTKIAGARAFAEVARAALAVAVDEPDEDEEEGDEPAEEKETVVILSQAKNNLGRTTLPNMTYTIQDTVVATEDGDAHVGRLVWTGESRRSAQEALNGGGRGKRGRAMSAKERGVFEWIGAQGHPVEAFKINEAFPSIATDTMRKLLSRMVDREYLTRPVWGFYAIHASHMGAATTATTATSPAHTHSLVVGGVSQGVTDDQGVVADVAVVTPGQGDRGVTP